MKLLLLVALCVAAAAAAGSSQGKNQQNGRFYFYKVRPRNAQQLEVLVQEHQEYGDHPPVWVNSFRAGESAYCFVDQSKTSFFERLLRQNKIRWDTKGLSLVESITAKQPSAAQAEPKNPSCDCDYHSGGCMISEPPPEGYACKCVYKGAWTCTGYAFSCDPGVQCPANCSSLECCKTGRGDCGGY